ncbi:MAG: 16S rRNA (cytidine(1402)-2'-O)-methyltransferase [Leuconostoc gelidum]|jgi:16S rRNA (cytidine1402-2'-O)-methyltransferase|uniref:Ribosomal RNA small subunit methyltransferase I n=1 Tax=Leuconostoc gelidum subsp. gelidum TaxID=1607839 RepID=A0AB35G1K7_LEUGE|nr:16S rRNA (cytidine(1402)-2'-O)-methyltransferase [Leuconostoc gelidum]AFS39800.1 methyltransferase [Leuconostoc gelidum JB7]MBZ5964678.1 16S rRNA (cytidine(1402)-2'-O)-methyltransferase [Leuconostoc gelidum subsp. gelidum]MBZ5974717.1 16S rRNA (cytidine(1402)-2'-O)-methyltransferase [Leuconostoc gelidum subsp. gelidum]MBZ5977557.1 16S rRNA (cytidine(1402)-2'-O)-methyltransferase [Leuconostoc gelidum subsp. gelidum]MBZ5979163.1 16S rRNA (cytidine(1402)-2'-O)-methyltransferase [Leuconostoc ge
MQQQKSFEKKQTGTLFLVPTPIGNLQDMTPRAIDTLKNVDLIAAEDTRHTQHLLNHFDIETKQTSFHEHNWQMKIPGIILDLQGGKNVAQVSDAGMPSISDPGKELVAAAIENNVTVVPIPGATAGVTALIASGLVPQPFYFYGFLQRKNNEQLAELQQLSSVRDTIIFYESPHRIKKTLENIQKVMGDDRRVVLARELTKRYEEFLRGTTQELVEWAKDNEIRGEFVVMIAGYQGVIEEQNKSDDRDLSVHDAVETLISRGLKPNMAIKQIAKSRGLDRQAVYSDYHGID